MCLMACVLCLLFDTACVTPREGGWSWWRLAAAMAFSELSGSSCVCSLAACGGHLRGDHPYPPYVRLVTLSSRVHQAAARYAGCPIGGASCMLVCPCGRYFLTTERVWSLFCAALARRLYFRPLHLGTPLTATLCGWWLFRAVCTAMHTTAMGNDTPADVVPFIWGPLLPHLCAAGGSFESCALPCTRLCRFVAPSPSHGGHLFWHLW